MRVALRHAGSLVSENLSCRVQVHALHHEPACRSMPEGVEAGVWDAETVKHPLGVHKEQFETAHIVAVLIQVDFPATISSD